MIRPTVKPWPKSEFHDPYHFHPAAGWDKATKTYNDSLAKRSFMEFAPEIRNIIYHALFVMPTAIYVQRLVVAYAMIPDAEQGWDNPRNVARRIIYQTDVMGLFLTCKTIYRETFPLYYSQNTFKCIDSDGLRKFADKLEPQPRLYVTKLSVVWTGPALAKAALALGSFVGLRELKMDIRAFYTFKKSTNQNAPVKIYGLKDLLRIRGLEKLEVQGCTRVHNLDRMTQRTQEQENAFMRSLEVLLRPRDVTFVEAIR